MIDNDRDDILQRERYSDDDRLERADYQEACKRWYIAQANNVATVWGAVPQAVTVAQDRH